MGAETRRIGRPQRRHHWRRWRLPAPTGCPLSAERCSKPKPKPKPKRKPKPKFWPQGEVTLVAVKTLAQVDEKVKAQFVRERDMMKHVSR